MRILKMFLRGVLRIAALGVPITIGVLALATSAFAGVSMLDTGTLRVTNVDFLSVQPKHKSAIMRDGDAHAVSISPKQWKERETLSADKDGAELLEGMLPEGAVAEFGATLNEFVARGYNIVMLKYGNRFFFLILRQEVFAEIASALDDTREASAGTGANSDALDALRKKL